MRIVCPTCETGYTVPDAKIGASGRQVRCVRCGSRWHVAPPGDSDDNDLAEPDPFADLQADADRDAAWREPEEDVRRQGRPDPGPDEDADPLAGLAGAPDEAVTFEDPPAAAGPQVAAAGPPSEDVATVDDGFDDIAFSEAPVAAAGPVADAPTANWLDPGEPEPPAVPPAPAGPASIDVESVAKKPTVKVKAKPRPRPSLRLKLPKMDVKAAWTQSKVYVGLGILCVALLLPVCAILARASLVEAVPSLAGLFRAIGLPVNLRGLAFQSVETLRELDSGQQVLVVEGAIANVSGETRAVPSVRLSLRGDDGQEIYAWSVEPKSTTVAPGASVRFRTKLAAPPDDARDVQIRFSERRSRQAANDRNHSQPPHRDPLPGH
ncbi:DUF3426 domain-containing protein [Prosthecomicrobium sp. N25]|uniref:DUF3426 domain-containing protein n=1 Tax=Prosthecomicrobium sp. N25 TaxID=3129254 RepID=UPI003076B67B